MPGQDSEGIFFNKRAIVKSSEPDLLEKAKNYCFLLLKFRLRSEKELYRRLKKKKFDEAVIKRTLDFLKDKGFIDDNYFAGAWIESRIKKPLGLRRLRQELSIKGIDKQTIDIQLEKIKNNYSEEAVVSKIIEGQSKKIKGIDPQKAKRRIYGYLLRRGFSPDTIINAMNQLS